MSQTQENNEESSLPPPPPDDDQLPSADNRILTPNVIYRAAWGARSPRKELNKLTLPATDVLITYTGTEECLTNNECLELVHQLQRRDMYDKGLGDIQYNFLIGGDATVYEGRGLHYEADKDPKHQDLAGKSIDIAYIGDFRDSVPLKSVIRAAGGLVQMLVENNNVNSEFNLTPLGNSQTTQVEGDDCTGEECVQDKDKDDPRWQQYPGFKSLDEILSKNLF